MCGIVGYTGQRQAQSILLDSLARVEYRGYDSCGIAVLNPDIQIFKDAVRVADLARTSPRLNGTVGIGHTRWATHGAPSQENAHPHTDCTGQFAVVHNGIITNYQKLTQQLISEGHRFSSATDTEIIAHLVEKYYQGDLEKAFERALQDIEGSYAIILIKSGESCLLVARKDSPLVIGRGDMENFVASDVPAILDQTVRVVYLEDGDIGVIDAQDIQIHQKGQLVKREEQHIIWQAEQAQKSGYDHYMIKEIHEQPRIIRETVAYYLAAGEKEYNLARLNASSSTGPLLVACGTSFHAALIGKYLGERLMGVPVRVELASELNYYDNFAFAPVTIGITQSGETADTLKALRRLKEAQSKIVAITNVMGSSSTKIADRVIYTRAGLEISVASTKSFTSQIVALFWLFFASATMENRAHNEIISEFRQLPDKVQQVLLREEQIAAVATDLARFDHVFYIGKGVNYPIAMEGALKLKEVSYIHSEAFAGGEIKHGPLALLTKETPVVAVISAGKSHSAMVTSIKEIKARGSPVVVVAEEGDSEVEDVADQVIYIPSSTDYFSPVLNAVVVQLLAYFAAKERRCPIDFPRNLAKSVTVE
jgi:glutamine---fructose-6-phosphate transaminase (isomerizing)